MKKLSLTIIVMIISLCNVDAQTEEAAHFDIRAYGGLNVLQLSTDEGETLIDGALDERVTGRPGAQYGASVTFGSRFFVQPGIQYSIFTSEIINENTLTGFELTDETTISTISIPLKVGFRLIDPETEDIFNVRVFGGLDGFHVMSVDHSSKSEEIDDIDEDDFSNLILNGDFGIGVDVLMFYLDAGYRLGLTPIYNSGNDATANAFYANLGVRFSL
jgi:hypothetical protein